MEEDRLGRLETLFEDPFRIVENTNAQVTKMRQGFKEFRAEMRQEVTGLRTEMN